MGLAALAPGLPPSLYSSPVAGPAPGRPINLLVRSLQQYCHVVVVTDIFICTYFSYLLLVVHCCRAVVNTVCEILPFTADAAKKSGALTQLQQLFLLVSV